MIDSLLKIIAPHYCSGCDKTGTLFCQNCKFDITQEAFDGCIVCGTACPAGVCQKCQTSFSVAWCVGERREALEKLINCFKFERAAAAHKALAELLDARLPQLPPNTVIVPVPTVASHIRQRGYDHTLLISRRLGKIRGLKVQTALFRASSTRQRGANKKQRLEQARQAYGFNAKLKSEAPYLLIDDICTTGATLRYAAETLKKAGAKDVWVAVVARQPLDK